MGQKQNNPGFVCKHCGNRVPPVDDGSYRNHCPRCLYSRHLDVRPGDRASLCGGLMAPIGVRFMDRRGWQIVHRCETCGMMRANRVAGGRCQPDAVDALADLATMGVARIPAD